MSSQVDLRGFKYPLEPELARRKWQLEQAQRKLESVQASIQKLRLRNEALQAAHQEETQRLTQTVAVGLNPAEYQRALVYLAWQRGEMEKNKEDMQAMEKEKSALTTACIDAQRKVDLTSSHRTDSLAAYVSEERTRQDNEMDRDWAARRLLFGAVDVENQLSEM